MWTPIRLGRGKEAMRRDGEICLRGFRRGRAWGKGNLRKLFGRSSIICSEKYPADELQPTKPLTVDLDESDDEETADTKSRTTAVRFSLPKANDLADNAEEDEEDEEDSELEGDDSMEGIQELEDAEQDEEDGEDEDEPSDLSLPSDLSEDGDDPDALDDLDSFVDQLASADKKRKVGDQRDLPVEAPKKRRVLPVMRGPSLNDAGDLGLKNSKSSPSKCLSSE